MQEVMNKNNGSTHVPPRHRIPRDITINEEQLKDLIFNATSRDTRALRQLMSEKRDYDSECDYPRDLTVENHYKFYFDYHAVGTRVCEVLPLETWQVLPSVFEDDDPNVKTEFEKAWDELGSSLRGQSWHKKEEGSPVWEYLKRADILSGIGSFGVILLGFDDGQPLNTPIAMLAEEDNEDESESWDTSSDDSEGAGDDETERVRGEMPTKNALGSIDSQYNGSMLGTEKIPKLKEGTKRKLIFMRPFDESLVQVTRLETDINSPRHNQPVMYRLTLIDPDFAKEHAISMDISCPEVHWTRILHIADNLTNSECFGVPRQQPVYRHLRNLYKLYGGAPEMYWRGALNGLSFETHPQLGGDVDIDTDAFKDMIENYRNGLQRDLQTTGMTVKSIAPTVVDPTPNINVQIQAICIKIGIPQRIFMGSERGELASTQDDSSWNDRLKHRQDTYVTPRIIIPFIDRMIATGVLPKPQGKIIEENLTEDDGNDQEVIETEEATTNFNPNQPRDKEGQFSSGGAAGGSTHSVKEITSALSSIYKKDKDPRNGGECGAVALTLMELNPELKAFAITTLSPYDDGSRGIAHVLVSSDGKKFLDARGKLLTKEAAMTNFDPNDKPTIVPLTYQKDIGRGGGLVSKDGGMIGAEVWPDYLNQIKSTISLQGKSEGKPTTNAFGKPSSTSQGAFGGGSKGKAPSFGGKPPSGAPSVSGGDPAAPAPAEAKARKLPEKDASPGYCITWPDLDSMTDAQKAAISLQKTQALMAFIAGNGESAMTLVDFYTKVLYLTDEEAIGVIQAVNQQIEDDERLTPDPEEARQDQMEMQAEQFDKELGAKKELAESGQGFQAAMFDKQSATDEKMANLKPKGKPTANFNPSQPRDEQGRFGAGKGSENLASIKGSRLAGRPKTDIAVASVFSVPQESVPQIVEDKASSQIEDINPQNLIPTQSTIRRKGVQEFIDKPPIYGDDTTTLPLVYKDSEGKLYLKDGHHRVAAEILSGTSTVRVRTLTHPTTNRRNLSALDKARMLVNYSPNQPRKADGKFGSGGSNGSAKATKAETAKASAVPVGKEIQNYAKANEASIAEKLGGVSFPDSEPVDVVVANKSGAAEHGIEMKTMVKNGNFKLTMDGYAQARKVNWEKSNPGSTMHTLVLDDHAVFNAKGPGKHDYSKREYYYRRGVAGSARVSGLHKAKDLAEVEKLMKMDESQLPKGARRSDSKMREGTWKPFTDAEGKGFKNKKTGKIVRAKKDSEE